MPAPQADSNTTPTELPLAERLEAKDWDTPVANHHYALGQIAGAVWLMLDGRGSLRGTALATGFISRLLGGKHEVPSPTSVRSWLLRVGLHQLQRPLEKADDWVWIVDHTVQIGELKCMIIVGFRLGAWQQQENRTLSHEDVELIGLWPVRTSTGQIVDGQLETAIGRTGLPQLVISDDGRDLHRGLALFQARHDEVVWIYDIKHKTASLLKRELENDPVWTLFAKQANQMKRQVYQTELAFCNPPQQRGKARYMNVDTLVAWGLKVLKWLDEPRPTGRELDADRIEEKLGWLRDYREPLRRWEQAMQVIETAETLVRREGYHAQSEDQFRQRLPQVEANSLADRLRGELLAFIKEQALHVPETQRLPGSSEVLESIIGKYKTLQGEQGQFGATSMLLAIGAFVGRLTVGCIRTALHTIKGSALEKWEQTNLGSTIQSQRKQAFSRPKRGTKTGSNELELTPAN
ncbi:MAG: hypothetical protein IH991_15415 [Planctomycetes bacterium]|nr:hypothetical protein [Planctomycetota bacterium]